MTKISCISEPSHPYEYWKPPPARNQYHVDSQVMTNDFFFTYQTLSNKYIFRIHHQRKKTRNSLLYNINLKEFIAEERRLHSPDHLNSVYSQPGYGHENR